MQPEGGEHAETQERLWDTEEPEGCGDALSASSFQQPASRNLERKTGNGFEVDKHKNTCFKFPVTLQTHYSGKMSELSTQGREAECSQVSELRSM